MGVGLTVLAVLITVMKGVSGKTWNVTLPERIVSITNSCVTIPCHFEVPESQEANLLKCSNGGNWKRGHIHSPPVFPTLQGQIIGDLTKKNCTTVFFSFPTDYSDVYFFRLDCDDPLKFTFNKGVIIHSQPEPPEPTLADVGRISEGSSVMLQCSAPVLCPILPPSLSWTHLGSYNDLGRKTQQSQSVAGQWMMTSTLTFIASAHHHQLSVGCSASYPRTRGGSTTSFANQILHVEYAPRYTTAALDVSGPVPEGRSVILTCTSDANPAVSSYTWYRQQGSALTVKGSGATLVLQVGLEDSGAYLCKAQSSLGYQNSSLVNLVVRPGCGDTLVALYGICGAVLVLFFLTVVVDLYKYQSVLRRLKQIELKWGQPFLPLGTVSANSDYEQLQFPHPKTKTSPEVDYENSSSPK
ncbi:myelin-associated glycoprotein [Echeneis naucrates]|uniref:myelin-associated glycoprotein n=1 Tax=Echeneis naucrates TaxID=173247 RepID=UPI001113E042|nr:myelin-associated glycoprotein-like [Echeneis naucrates]